MAIARATIEKTHQTRHVAMADLVEARCLVRANDIEGARRVFGSVRLDRDALDPGWRRRIAALEQSLAVGPRHAPVGTPQR